MSAPQRVTIDSCGVPLAALLYLPDACPRGALLVCHGAGSRKENHVIMAEQAVAAGLAALPFDFRGHGESSGAMDADGSDDVIAAGDALLRLSGAPWVAARGASMGAMLLVLAARRRPDLLRSLVLLCPADGPSLLRGLDRAAGRDSRSAPRPSGGAAAASPADPSWPEDRYAGRFDEAALRPFLARLDLIAEARGLRRVLLAHARDDAEVSFDHSRRLAAVLEPPARFIVLAEGGHHGPGRSPDVARATLAWVLAHGTTV
ncbi:MAG TPA: alpha/beta fold hydrolase [Thermoleophilia bacterium]|nr:alpha/beta fold hydrolase [Thermoleophilia bacterium]